MTRPALPAPVRLAISVVVGGLATIALGLLALTVVIPMVMHWVPLTVLSGSMEPTIPIGSQVIVKRVESEQDVASLQRGDVITFLPRPGDNSLVTHRITSVSVDSEGVHHVKTKGAHNPSEDLEVKTVKQIRGVVVYHLPKVGYLANALNRDQKSRGIVVVAGALFAYALWQLLGLLRSRRVQQPAAVADADAPPQDAP
ncbi:hypothetical protein ADJ73_06950 [Arsenicicoccus sp. oral taxon 190]|nr:hypothetical protein ADJ73_06950 [Arsenicicoccus sp. oral taxon 190]